MVRPDPQTVPQLGRKLPAVPMGDARHRDETRNRCGQQAQHTGMLGEDLGHHQLVLLRREGTGGIKNAPARTTALHRLAQQRPLTRPQAQRAVRIEPGQQGGSAPKGALARAGRIDQDAVELTARARPVGAVAAGGGDVDHAEPVEIALERLDPRMGDVVRDEGPAIAQCEGDLRCLAAGCRTEIQHPLTRRQVHQHRRQLRDFLLCVGKTGAVPPVAAGLGLLGQSQGSGQTRHRLRLQTLLGQQIGQLGDRDPCRVGPDTGRQRSAERRGKGVPIVDQGAITGQGRGGDLLGRDERGRLRARETHARRARVGG